MPPSNQGAEQDDLTLVILLGGGMIALAAFTYYLADDIQRLGLFLAYAKAKILAPLAAWFQELRGCNDVGEFLRVNTRLRTQTSWQELMIANPWTSCWVPAPRQDGLSLFELLVRAYESDDPKNLRLFFNSEDPSQSQSTVLGLARVTGQIPALLIYVPILVLGFIYITYTHRAVRFRRKLNLDGFMHFQSKAWHSILPAVVTNPLEDVSKQWGEAQSPKEWIERNEILVIDGVPDREGVRDAFVRQLRNPWRGIKHMAPHRQALVAVFALVAARKGRQGRDLLADLSRAWTVHRSIGKAIIKDASLRKRIAAVITDNDMMNRIMEASRLHAFEETVLAAMLSFARARAGVLASAEFLWLKPDDRALWYILNNVGRPTFHVECAGVVAHLKAETASRRPLPEPDVDEAVFGLEEYIQRFGLT